MTGHDMMERALILRTQYGVTVAAKWLERQGIVRDLAIFALVGGHGALKFGVSHTPGWNLNRARR